ncbi:MULTISPECIES: DUF402 domain-containing protein [unclassified Nocardioides]|uniref:DUF402 domain-containing protein n=1 Tax=unclassified Nocardioides TaxID=2615069 RepID=UPI0006FF125B|nr:MULTISPECIES: DUF402 domain-containing protein [unclassified Nocardioides]KQY55533.1 hypothetical protein ASD30_16710 [Nocardioides sp. Root140]KQZ67194.1 hypothetical protein ASD66_19650 [Nocardioides sp. Root151]
MEFGDPIDVAMTKWRDRPHWAYRAHYLGRDEHGDWLGVPAGTRMARPGVEMLSAVDQVCLAPTTGDLSQSGWFATFHARRADGTGAGFEPAFPVEVYVDIATQPVWDGTTVRSVDLDLDVVRAFSGRTWIDDEDEFAEHRVALGYPDEVIELALANCAAVHAAVLGQVAPYDGPTAAAWRAMLDGLS